MNEHLQHLCSTLLLQCFRRLWSPMKRGIPPTPSLHSSASARCLYHRVEFMQSSLGPTITVVYFSFYAIHQHSLYSNTTLTVVIWICVRTQEVHNIRRFIKWSCPVTSSPLRWKCLILNPWGALGKFFLHKFDPNVIWKLSEYPDFIQIRIRMPK